jgi:hypothetical protein
MGRPSRQQIAERAAMEASEAGRVLQAQRNTEPEPESSQVEAPKAETERPVARNEPRRRAMEEIEQRDLETKGIAEAQPKPEVTPNPPPPTPESMLEGGKFSEAPAETAVETPAEPVIETVKVKVDGEEFDVPKAEIEEAGGIKAYQKDRAAENRLKKANEANDRAQQTMAAMAQWIQQQQRAQQPAPQTPDQLIAEKIDVIRYGSPEESAAALREVLEKSNPRIDQNALLQASTTLAVSRMQQSLAVEKFKQEFPEVVANQLVMKLATTLENERIAQMQQAGHTPDWTSFYNQLGNEVRNVIGKPSQPAPAPNDPSTPSPVVDKEARKASIVILPTAAARASLPEAPKPETREDTLNSMRKARGIPTG